MLKSIEKLLESAKNEMKVGNYGMFHHEVQGELIKCFTYKDVVVVSVNVTQEVALIMSGDKGANKAIDDLKTFYTLIGYEVYDIREN